MTGTAALAMIALPSASSAEQKWQPYSEVGGKVGDDRAIGQVEFFVPLWQDNDTIFFGDVRGRIDSESSEEGNFGVGLRERINPEWILGVYGFYDVKNSEYDNTFDQFSAGIEFMSEDWDFRLNAYLADDELEFVPGLAHVVVNGSSIQMFNGAEGALSGFDGEVGYRVWKDAMMEARLFIGGFYFDHDDLTEVAGPRARAELRMFDLDFLGAQSRLTFEGEVQHDEVRDTTAFAGLSLRVPLSAATGGGADQISGLDQRMVDSIRRDVDIVTNISGELETFAEDIFLVSQTGQVGSFDTVVYVDNTGGGAGTYVDPEDFDQATFTAGDEGTIFVALDATGIIDAPTKGVALEDGQSLLGGGTTIKAKGATSGQYAYFTFDGSRPEIDGTDGGYDIVTLADDNWIENIDFAGKFANAIYGNNVSGFEIEDIAVDGTAGGGQGIYLYNDVSGDFGGAIRGSSFDFLSGDAIDVNTILADGGTSTLSLTIEDSSAYSPDVDGLHFYTSVTAGSDIAVDLTVDGFDVIYAGDEGISIFNDAGGAGSTIDGTGSFALTDVYVYGAGDYGVFFGNYADTLASIDADFHFNGVEAVENSSVGVGGGADARSGATVTVSIDGTGITADGNGSDGIFIYAESYNGDTAGPDFIPSTVNMTLDLDAVTATDNFNFGISLDASAEDGGATTLSGGLGAVTSTGNGDDGLALQAYAGGTTSYGGTLYTSSVTQAITSTGGNVSDNGDVGISVQADAADGGSITQSFAATGDLTVDYNTGRGIFQYANADTYASLGADYFFSSIKQGVTLAGGSLSNNGSNGVYVQGKSADVSSVDQDLDLTDVTIETNVGDGVRVGGTSEDFLYTTSLQRGRLDQDVTITGGSISKNSDDGFDIAGDVSNIARLYQSVIVTDATISGNSGGGVYMDIESKDGKDIGGFPYGSFGTQYLVLSGTTVSGNDYGLYIDADATGGADATQYITLSNAALIDDNGGTGIAIYGNSDGYYASGGYDRSYVAQSLVVTGGSDITNNSGDGIFFSQTVSDEAESDLQIYLEGGGADLATISGNSGDGIDVRSAATEGGYNDLDLGFTDSSVSGNGGYGVYILSTTNDSGIANYFTTDTDIYVETDNAAFDNNGTSGNYDGFRVDMDVTSTGVGGSEGSLSMNITDSTFDGNSDDGIDLDVTASGANATVSSTVSIDPSSLSNNDGDGLYFNFETYDKSTGTVGLTLLDSAFDGNGGDGVDFDVDSYSGSAIVATLTATNSTFTGNGDDGLNADFYSGGVNGGTSSKMTATVTIEDVTANDSDDDDGVDIAFRAYYGGQTKGTATLTDVTANNNDSDGIVLTVDSYDQSGGTYSYANGSFTLTGAAASGNDDGLIFYVQAEYGAGAYGALNVTDGTFDANATNATIDVYANADGDASANVNIDDSTFTNATVGQGILIDVDSFNGNSYTDLVLDIGGGDISGNAGAGIYASQTIDTGYDSAMDIYVNSTTITDNGLDGISVDAKNENGVAYMDTSLILYGVTISGNAGDGVDFRAAGTVPDADVYAELYIGVNGLTGSTITKNGGNGVYASGSVTGLGSDGYFEVDVIDSDVTYNNGAGVYVAVSSETDATLVSNVYAGGVTVSKNGGAGIVVDAYVGNNAYIESDVEIDTAIVTYNGGAGISVELAAYNGGEDINTSTTLINNVNASFNDGAGVSVAVSSDNGEITGAAVTISNVNASYNGDGGIAVTALAENGGYLAITDVALSYVTAQKNDGAGVYLGNAADGAGSSSYFDALLVDADFELYEVNASYNDVGIVIRNAATNGGLGTLANQDIDGKYLSAVGVGIDLGPPAVFPDGMRFINLGTNGGTDAYQNIDVNYIDVSDNFIGVRIQDGTAGNQSGTINNATYYNTPFLYFYVGGGGGFVITP